MIIIRYKKTDKRSKNKLQSERMAAAVVLLFVDWFKLN